MGGVFGPTVQDWIAPGFVRNTHHRGFARPTSGMLPSTAVDGRMDRVLVVFHVFGQCPRGFFPDSVSDEDVRECLCNWFATQVCATVRRCSSQWLWKGGVCVCVCWC